MQLRTCVVPGGSFKYGIHKPAFKIQNFRYNDFKTTLGVDNDGSLYDNGSNFPSGNLTEPEADWIYEIPNPFPFRGTTYIAKRWATAGAANPSGIYLPQPEKSSFCKSLKKSLEPKNIARDSDISSKLDRIFEALPVVMQLAMATGSTDPEDLVRLANLSCKFIKDSQTSRPVGLKYIKKSEGQLRPLILNHDLFEALANNINLPDDYKEVMVLRPGVQGDSEIVGEYGNQKETTHVFEYLRRNSYIPWGHYAANMADDAIRYSISDLSNNDLKGLRHLYYQRSYAQMAALLDLPLPPLKQLITKENLELLRCRIKNTIQQKSAKNSLNFNSTLWGWNYGFDVASSGYRLHASHQQIHQQYALLPSKVNVYTSHGINNQDSEDTMPAFSCGAMIESFIARYQELSDSLFFEDYIKAIQTNQRMDGRTDLPKSLIVYENQDVMLFVPKAQTSQWELQLVTLGNVGNILEADIRVRQSMDQTILLAMRVLTALGAKMITTIEFSKRFDQKKSDQRLLYSFLPKLPQSPGAFSEAQLRWINGHFPEDFARACRAKLAE